MLHRALRISFMVCCHTCLCHLTVFHRGDTVYLFHQQCLKFQFSASLHLLFPIFFLFYYIHLTGFEVDLVCIFLMINGASQVAHW